MGVKIVAVLIFYLCPLLFLLLMVDTYGSGTYRSGGSYGGGYSDDVKEPKRKEKSSSTRAKGSLRSSKDRYRKDMENFERAAFWINVLDEDD